MRTNTSSSESNDAKKYHVALSFAGEDRAYVDQVASDLRDRGVSVFYDKYEEASMWGKDLYSHLSDVYSNQAFFTLMFISAAYKDKLWTNHERRGAQERAFRENREYILPVRFDDSDVPGISETVAYISARERKPAELVDLVITKLISYNLSHHSESEIGAPTSLSGMLYATLSRYSLFPADLDQGGRKSYCDTASSNYVEYCHGLYQNMRILAMPKPVELSHIFTQGKSGGSHKKPSIRD
jgi:hypothetical protein